MRYTFLLLLLPTALPAAPPDFARDVLPLLSENCFQCHGPDEKARKAKLRLDTQDGFQPAAKDVLARITSADPNEVMPPPKSKKNLTPAQIATLKQWIDGGAAWGKHWAFTPPVKSQIPKTKSQAKNPIDAFVFARLEKEGLTPSAEASKETLIRRVTLDLTGLPPTIEEVDAFLKDTSPTAYEKVVDRLLASPHYGERMVWEWLDAARYADSNGYQGDGERTQWPWRDWAVKAFNEDLPFDQFTTWQLAGDLLPSATPEQNLATAFLRNHMINGEGGRIAEENRVDYVMDMTETVGTVWLGLTFNCCRCHDHKFDPLKQREYYQLLAFFNQTSVNGGGGSPQTPPVLQVKVPDADAPQKDGKPQPLSVMVMEDMPKSRDTFIHEKGLYNKTGAKVEMGFPEILLSQGAAVPGLPLPKSRLDLAKWLTSPNHPLTARVVVNRLWQQLFGLGLVKTVEDFGVQGERPAHQELLDWLAVEFRDSGWSTKKLVRLLVTSATYRQSSKITPELHERDPENRLLARGPRYRLPSWMLRDQALAASGLLVRTVGGKPVNPYQPAGIWEETTFGNKRYTQDHGDALYRRSVYTFWRRIVAPTLFFDGATRQTCTVKQTRTNSPLHALTTLNDVTYVEAARVLAERAMLAETDEAKRIEWIVRRVLTRRPSAEEAKVLAASLTKWKTHFTTEPAAVRKLLATGESKRKETLSATDHAAFTTLALLVLNLDEALCKE